jgi:hypothetical protein
MGLGARLEDGFDASKVRNIIDNWRVKRKGDLFCEVQQSIESFANKPVVLTHVPKD